MLDNKFISVTVIFLGLSFFFSFLAAHCKESNYSNYDTDGNIKNGKTSVLHGFIAVWVRI
jgi:hypothetical protein